jgi:dolichol-phosphate mannosyltransferase
METLVVLPTYNEALTIEPVLRRIRNSLPEAHVLVVDDGSPDGTADKAQTMAVESGRIEIMRRAAKSGLGSAYRTGFSWGLERGFDAFVEMDADLSHEPEALPGLIAPLGEGFDLSIGSRYTTGGSIPHWTRRRRMLSWGGNLYASAMLGLSVSDSTSGFRAYSSTVLGRLDLGKVSADGYGFQIEMTYLARQAGASIIEVPIRFVDRVDGESKMSPLIILEALGLVTKWGCERLFEIEDLSAIRPPGAAAVRAA